MYRDRRDLVVYVALLPRRGVDSTATIFVAKCSTHQAIVAIAVITIPEFNWLPI